MTSKRMVFVPDFYAICNFYKLTTSYLYPSEDFCYDNRAWDEKTHNKGVWYRRLS